MNTKPFYILIVVLVILSVLVLILPTHEPEPAIQDSFQIGLFCNSYEVVGDEIVLLIYRCGDD